MALSVSSFFSVYNCLENCLQSMKKNGLSEEKERDLFHLRINGQLTSHTKIVTFQWSIWKTFCADGWDRLGKVLPADCKGLLINKWKILQVDAFDLRTANTRKEDTIVKITDEGRDYKSYEKMILQNKK